METLGSEVRKKTTEALQPSQLSNAETGCILLVRLGALITGCFSVASCSSAGRESFKISAVASFTPCWSLWKREVCGPQDFCV